MKQTQLPYSLAGRSGRLARRIATLSAALLLGAIQPAIAQWSGERSYFFPSYSMKHFAITPVEGADEYMTAGTVFSFKRSRLATPTNAIHWMYIDDNANVIFSKIIDRDIYDERPVGIHMYGDNAVIVATHRDETPVVSGSTLAAAAGVEILSIDKTTGNLGASKLITSTDPDYRNLYPLATLKIDDQLFVCGYATFDNNSAIPDLSTPKVSFIFRFDVPNNALADMRFIESAYNPTTYDFDMATRMKQVSNGIWVGGSTNGGPMMNRIIDPNTLQDNVSIPATAIGAWNTGDYENSYDVIEADNGDLFVFGNTYSINTASTATPLLPLYTHITAVQPNLVPYPGNSRWQFTVFDSPWGVNVLQDRDDRSSVVINGLGTNRMCNQAPLTTTSNINPFLAGMKLEVLPGSGDINVTPQFWNTMLSYNGTGTATLAASYFRVGAFMSSIMLPPVSAVQNYSVSSDIVLTCPLWDNSSRLDFKLIKAKNSGEVEDCDWAPTCIDIQGFGMPSVSGNPGINFQTTGLVTSLENDIFEFQPDHIDDCSGHYKPNPDNTTGVTAVASVGNSCRVYPNPADDQLVIELPDAASASIRIFDVQGRTFTEQHLRGQRSLKLDVSAYPSGLYFYTIQYNGIVQSGKLTIR